jgi:hypothetical protein
VAVAGIGGVVEDARERARVAPTGATVTADDAPLVQLARDRPHADAGGELLEDTPHDARVLGVWPHLSVPRLADVAEGDSNAPRGRSCARQLEMLPADALGLVLALVLSPSADRLSDRPPRGCGEVDGPRLDGVDLGTARLDDLDELLELGGAAVEAVRVPGGYGARPILRSSRRRR